MSIEALTQPWSGTAAGLSLLLLVAGSGPGHAAGWEYRPSVGVEERYDDNPSLTPTGEDAVNATRIAGSLSLTRLAEISEVETTLRADAIKYHGAEHDIDEQSNQLLDVDGFRRGERSRLDLDASFRRDTLLRTVEAFAEPEEVELDPAQDVDVGLVDVGIRRNRFLLNPRWSYNLSERHAVSVAYRFDNVTYGDTRGTALSDYRDQAVAVQSSYGLTEIDSFRTRLETSRFESRDLDREYTSNALIGEIEHEFSEVMTGGATLGLHRTDFDVEDTPGEENGMILGVFGDRDFGLTRFAGRARRSLSPSGGGDLVQTDELTFNWTRKISPLINVSVRTRLFENESLRKDNPSVNRRYLSLAPRIRWNLTRWWSFDARYRYRRQKRDTDPDSASSHAIFLAIYYSEPRAID